MEFLSSWMCPFLKPSTNFSETQPYFSSKVFSSSSSSWRPTGLIWTSADNLLTSCLAFLRILCTLRTFQIPDKFLTLDGANIRTQTSSDAFL
jgi:hypothetical protein